MKAAVIALLVVLSFGAAADDYCLTTAIEQAKPLSQMRGQIVVSTLTFDGKRETRVLASEKARGEKLVGNEGFRIASVTKTYVAATLLRLWEDGKVDLHAPITTYLPGDWVSLLARDGYRAEQITVRHLLSHTAGLADHAQTAQFIATIKENPTSDWTRERHLQALVDWTDPVGAPGEKYSYSDTGYVLLGSIVERITGEDLPRTVRTVLSLDALAPDTYWERFERARGSGRAHQIFEGLDTYGWNPSIDLFGGGGLVAPTQDMAAFFGALLRGDVFRRSETLEIMRSGQELPKDSTYRLGLIIYDFDGVQGVGHSGFWGTLVVHEPRSQRTIAGAVTDRGDFPKLKQIVGEYVERSAASAATRSKVRCHANAQSALQEHAPLESK